MNKMNKFLFLVLIFFLFVSQLFSQNIPQKIAGAYQWCPFPCETIKLNQDFTFDYLLDGDLFNNERTKGTWKFVGENKIYLKSPERKLVYKIIEEQNENADKILIQVIDFNGAVFPGIPIKIKSQEREKQFVTNENGTCEIPNTDEITFDWMRFSESYKIENPKTNKLTVEIESTTEPSVDDNFIFKDGQLFKVFEDNTISENGYKKLSKKKASKLFPKN